MNIDHNTENLYLKNHEDINGLQDSPIGFEKSHECLIAWYKKARLEKCDLHDTRIQQLKDEMLAHIEAASLEKILYYIMLIKMDFDQVYNTVTDPYHTPEIEYMGWISHILFDRYTHDFLSQKFSEAVLVTMPLEKRESLVEKIDDIHAVLKIASHINISQQDKYSRVILSLKILIMKIDKIEKSEPKNEGDLVSAHFRRLDRRPLLSAHFENTSEDIASLHSKHFKNI